MRELFSDLAGLGSLGLMLILGGCTTLTKPAPAGPVTHFVVVNLSDYEWRIAIAPTGGGEARALRLPARALQEIDVAAGDYVIDQTMLTGNAEPASTRRLTIRLEPGQTYRWRLVTLLSAPMQESGRERWEPGRE